MKKFIITYYSVELNKEIKQEIEVFNYEEALEFANMFLSVHNLILSSIKESE